jgi:hypothetical protein
MKDQEKVLSPDQREALLQTLKSRFEKNMSRHKQIKWAGVLERLEAHPDKLWSLAAMEASGGEPDVVGYTDAQGYRYFDCSAESPKGRRSLCYDQAALDARKENKPQGSALSLAAAMGIEILTAEQYKELQQLGNYDAKTSSWIRTPDEIRKLGGALFSDFRYDTVFVYHNGAESYYAARGFRGCVNV